MKYEVTVKYIQEAYVQIEADSKEEAIEKVAEMNDYDIGLEPYADYEEYEAELLEEGNKNEPKP